MTLQPGTRIGSYEILAPLGAGGMGEVYRARDAKLDRDVAVKVLPAHLTADPDSLARFEREAKAVAALSHPNILSIFDFGSYDGVVYVAMELLEGQTLRELIAATGALPTRKVIDYCVQAARALAAAHGRGIYHRDLKPENIFVTVDGRVKILDFGLALRASAFTGADVTLSPPMTATTLLTGTVSPSLALMSVRTPAAGDGISASTLSVEISKRGSSRSTGSPIFLIQRTIVPSAIDSPI